MRFYRRLPLDGLMNARDLGGFPTCGGGVTRTGVFIRSEAPLSVSGADTEFLHDYGVRFTLDLRSESEARANPSRLAETPLFRHILLPMFDPDAAAGSEAKSGRGVDFSAFHGWGQAYIDMVEEHRDWTLKLMDIFAEANGGCLFHCFTGKDRTGIAAAFLLSVAGVSDNDIIADYSVSETYLQPMYSELSKTMTRTPDGTAPHEGDWVKSSPFFSTAPENMRFFLSSLGKKYGCVKNFLLDCGVSDGVLDEIRMKFVE